ncbi:hypothetical protein BH23ACT9_BH23ACT9_08120 [soil metagenome]
MRQLLALLIALALTGCAATPDNSVDPGVLAVAAETTRATGTARLSVEFDFGSAVPESVTDALPTTTGVVDFDSGAVQTTITVDPAAIEELAAAGDGTLPDPGSIEGATSPAVAMAAPFFGTTTALTIDGESFVKLPRAERWRRQAGDAVPTDPLSAALTRGDPTALLDVLADAGEDLRVSSVDVAGVAATRYEGPSSLTDLLPGAPDPSSEAASAIRGQDVVVHVVVEDDTNLLREIGITVDAEGTAVGVVMRLSDFGGPDPLQRPGAEEIDEDAEPLGPEDFTGTPAGVTADVDDRGLPADFPDLPGEELYANRGGGVNTTVERFTSVAGGDLAEVREEALAALEEAGWTPRPGTIPQRTVVGRGNWGGHVDITEVDGNIDLIVRLAG